MRRTIIRTILNRFTVQLDSIIIPFHQNRSYTLRISIVIHCRFLNGNDVPPHFGVLLCEYRTNYCTFILSIHSVIQPKFIWLFIDIIIVIKDCKKQRHLNMKRNPSWESGSVVSFDVDFIVCILKLFLQLWQQLFFYISVFLSCRLRLVACDWLAS